MDLSKLPKLSKTDQSSEQANQAYERAHVEQSSEWAIDRQSYVAEAWISVAVGAIFLLLQGTFLKWLFSGEGPEVLDQKRGMISYTQSYFFLNDLGLAVFGLAMIVDGIMLLISRAPVMVAIALGLTSLATLMNLITIVATYAGFGFQLMPALAVLIGGYLAICQFSLLMRVLQRRTAA